MCVVADPQPERGEVAVRVRATAVNRADLLQRMGYYPAPPGAPPNVPGLEIAGEVDAVGDGVTDLALGDRVFGLVSGGGYAERVVAHARTLVRIPENLSFANAAAVPEAFITAWDAMITQGRLGAAETVVVHAAGSGVGSAAFQIAKAVGAFPIGTARSAEKLNRARALGLVDSILVREGKFANDVLARTGGRGADVVLELVGGAYVAEDLACLSSRGRLVIVGLVGGARSDVDFGLLMRKRIELRGTALRSRPLEEKILVARVLDKRLAPLLARDVLRPVVDRVLPLGAAAEAHRALAANETFGKIVLAI